MGTNHWWRGRRTTATLKEPTTTSSSVSLAGRAGTPLRLNVLGQVELLWRDGGRVRDLAAVLTPKQVEILVFVALRPGPGVTREALNNAVWPTRPLARPYNSLHNALSLMRSTVARETDGAVRDVVVGSRGIYRINEDVVEVDYWSFRRPNSPDELARLYRGDLAENLTASWLEGSRVAVRRKVLDVLDELISNGEKDCFPAVLRILDQVRAADPYNEALYRDIIRVQIALGETEGARGTFAMLAASMKELGCEVSRETIDFLARMKTPARGSSRRAAS